MPYTPSSLIEAVRYFADLRVCNEYMRSIKWPDGQLCCHNCGSLAVYELSTRPVLKCRDCKKQFSYKVGTIFEDSPLGLDKWFSMDAKRPKGFKAFDNLMRKLVKVPPAAVKRAAKPRRKKK